MAFSEVVREGINKIYREDLKSQEIYLKNICETVRNMSYYEVLKEGEAFFVPNPEYILNYFGNDATILDYDLYDFYGNCTWDNMIVFPIKDLVGNIVGLAGYDVITKVRQASGMGAETINVYRYSSSTVFNRGKYLYTLPGIYRKAIEDKYIVLVDGIFDMYSFHAHGVNAASGLGSQLSPEVLFQLRFVETVFVAEDNDRAGRDLYSALVKQHPKVRYLRQSKYKDSDDIIKSPLGTEYLDKVREAILKSEDLTLRYKPIMREEV